MSKGRIVKTKNVFGERVELKENSVFVTRRISRKEARILRRAVLKGGFLAGIMSAVLYIGILVGLILLLNAIIGKISPNQSWSGAFLDWGVLAGMAVASLFSMITSVITGIICARRYSRKVTKWGIEQSFAVVFLTLAAGFVLTFVMLFAALIIESMFR